MRKFALMALTALSFNMTPWASSEPIEAFDMQRCVNMGNSLDSPKGAAWGKPIDVDHFRMIKAKGFDTVRIPVRWSDYTSGAPDYLIDPAFMNDVERIVDSALSEGLNVILNVHHFLEIMDEPERHISQLDAMWAQISVRFADHADSLWFEVLNEPNNELNGKIMREVQTLSVKTIRKTNPERVIILGGEDWSGIDSLPTNIPPPDENIVYTFHYYDPFEFTHQKATWLGEHMPKGERTWGNEDDYDGLREAISTATAFGEVIDRPVFLGEFGAYDQIPNTERVQYVRDVRQAMEDAQIPWCLWSFSNTFALYNADEPAWDEDMLRALIPDIDTLATQVVSANDSTTTQETWGSFSAYFTGETDFTQDALTGVATIKPGQEIHPPHKHIEEEYLMVLEGEGTWSPDGEDFPARVGDILYAAPWDLHGIRNTGTEPLKFVVFKYSGK